MAEPFTYKDSPLVAPDTTPAKTWQGAPAPGSKAPDVPCICWTGGEGQPVFLRRLLGAGFVILYFAADAAEGQSFLQAACSQLPGIPLRAYSVVSRPPEQALPDSLLIDKDGALQTAFAAQPGTLYLVRPDGHIAARRRNAQANEVAEMLHRACGMGETISTTLQSSQGRFGGQELQDPAQ